MDVFLSRMHFPITTLGPGRRVGIWFQGCSLNCPGCISVDTWKHGEGKISLNSVFKTLRPWLEMSEGVTISGGEPFEQAMALEAFLKQLRPALEPEQDVLVYTGWRAERALALLQKWEVLPDAILADPYIASAKHTLAWRGSDNQRLLPLTELGIHRYTPWIDALRQQLPKSLDLVFEQNTVWMAGIPDPEGLQILETALNDSGFQATLSSENKSSSPPFFA